jgi:hypothetical protein
MIALKDARQELPTDGHRSIDRESESVSICVYLWALFLLAKVRGRIEQEAAEQTETLLEKCAVDFEPQRTLRSTETARVSQSFLRALRGLCGSIFVFPS